MGMQLGKSNATLTTFDVSGVDVDFEDFSNEDRSINKSLQAYMFKEKGEFSYDFSHMDEADYRNMLEMILNRNSLREGLLHLPIPYSHESTKAILPVTQANAHKAYWFRTTDDPSDTSVVTFGVADPPTFDAVASTEFTNGEYNDIDAYDTNSVEIAASSTQYSGLVFVFDLTDFVGEWSSQELRRLTLAFHGMKSSPIRFFIYNHTQSAWYLIDERYYYDDTDFSDAAFNLNKQLVAQMSVPWGDDSIASDYLASNKAYIMIVPNAVDTLILVQYIRLLVNGYWVKSPRSKDIENFANEFTGAGRSGSLTFAEM
jgi:hypothetical protein